MNQYRLIDAKTAAKTRMTPEEAQAVIEMWSLQHRLQPDLEGPSLADVAEGLTIPPSEVNLYLRQIRSARPTSTRPARSIATDVKLAVAAMAAIVLIWGSIAGALGARGSNMYPRPMMDVVRVLKDGTVVTTVNYPEEHWLTNRTVNPDRFAFAVGMTRFEPPRSHPIKNDLESIKAALRQAVGGPLSNHSEVLSTPLTDQNVAEAIASDPSRASQMGPSASTYDSPSPYRPSQLVEWNTVRAAFGGKAISANLPFARFTDPKLRGAVLKEQDRLIDELAKAALDLAGAPASPAGTGK